MAQVNNYEWLEFSLPDGWVELARKMITECEAEEPNWEIIDLKEKFGAIRCYYVNGTQKIDNIIDKYEQISAKTCCRCGKPATKISTGWILPWCDECGKDEKKYYKRFDE